MPIGNCKGSQLAEIVFEQKAAVNTPQSKRFAIHDDPSPCAKRLDCGDFSAAFVTRGSFIQPKFPTAPTAPLKRTQSRRFAFHHAGNHSAFIPSAPAHK